MYEDSLTAIKREVMEKLGYDIDFTLCSIQENFVIRRSIKIMQYTFFVIKVFIKVLLILINLFVKTITINIFLLG
ncbi:MAG: hypothetical protein L6V91_06610 [Bacilli bacterium]|nr:MAG: hypothetical protein L6V91_06610 [Bacilli bacterium]